MPRATVFLILALVAARSIVAQSPVAYTFLTSFSPNFAPADVRVADVTGGPAPDILFTSNTGNFLRILENTGFASAPPFQDVPVGQGPTRITVGDFDGDGDQDIATANTNDVTVLLRTGAAYSRTDYSIAGVGETSITDVDGDGVKDLIRGGGVCVGTTPGHFVSTPTSLLPAVAPYFDAFVRDFDGDGEQDILTLTTSGSTVQIDNYRGDGAGTFQSPATTSVPGGLAWALPGGTRTVGDLTGEGLPDLAIVVNLTPFRGLVILAAQPNGAFVAGPPTQICNDYSTNLWAPIVADLDGDGWKDVIVRGAYPPVGGFANAWNVFTATLRNAGAGVLFQPQVFADTTASFSIVSPPSPRVFDVGDLDLDGDQDLVQRAPISPPASNIDIHLAAPVVAPPLAGQQLTPVSAQNQVLPSATQLAGAFVVRVTNGGQPVAGASVVWNLSSGLTTAYACLSTLSDAAGLATASVATQSYTGPVTATAVLGDGQSTTFNATVVQPSLTLVSGNAQTITLAGIPPAPVTPPAPLVVRATDPAGQPIAGIAVRFSNPGTSAVFPFVNPTTVLTDAQGYASLTLTPTATFSSLAVTAQAAQFVSVTFNLTIPGPTVSIVSGGGQATDPFDVFHAPLVAAVVDAFGAPIPGVPVTFSPGIQNNPVQLVISPTVAITDGQGRAQTTVTSIGATYINVYVNASIAESSAIAVFPLFVRRLSISGSAFAQQVTLTYAHEAGPTPLVFTADVPQSAPTTTPYGDLWTSIAAPGPGLYVADALGTFGALDPGLVANPTWTRTYAIPPSLAGFTFVAQILGFDAAYYPDLLQAIFVSNPVLKTL